MILDTQRTPRLAVIASLLCLVAQPCATAADRQGAQLAASCSSCHRVDGHSTGIPSVVGLDERRIEQLLLAYRSGDRAGHIMQVVAAALSPEEIAVVARYLAGQSQASGK